MACMISSLNSNTATKICTWNGRPFYWAPTSWPNPSPRNQKNVAAMVLLDPTIRLPLRINTQGPPLLSKKHTELCFFPTLRIWKPERSKIATLIQLDIGIIVISLISWFCCWPCVPLQNELKQKYNMKTFKHELQYLHCLRKEGSLCIPFLRSWNTNVSTCILLDII